MLEKPLDQRLMIAAMWRAQSKAMNSNKPENIMDVTPDDAVHALEAAGVRTLLHGHTHRPAHHDIAAAGKPAWRIVLGDWREEDGSAVVAVADASGLRLEDWLF